MASPGFVPLPRWAVALPPIALVALVATWGRDLGVALLVIVAAVLVAAVLTAVHHAEVVALRVGEPFGTLILAVAVTVIEVGLIVTLMVSSSGNTATLARDTVFAAIMITCNLVIGISLLAGPLRHRVLAFRPEGASGALAIMATLVTLSLVLPTFTTSAEGRTFTGSQLAFAGVASLVLYGTFVFVQTVRHRDYFLPVSADVQSAASALEGESAALAARRDDAGFEDAIAEEHAAPPSDRDSWIASGMLVVCLVAVVGLAKTVSPNIEEGVEAIGAPQSLVGVVIALLVLLPETVAAVRAALRNRVQTSLNLALGSALASIGLTIPVIALASIWLPGALELGLGGKELVLLALTVSITTLTLVIGRATLLQGVLHLVTFAAFLFLAVVP